MKQRIVIAVLAAMMAGCRDELHTKLWEQIETLSDERTALSLRVEQLEAENDALAGQVETLAAIDKVIRIEAMVAPVKLTIGQHSGLYDKNRNGSPETLVVHLIPTDAAQDAVKTAGAVRVELWNLTASPKTAQLASWQIGPDALNKSWGRGLSGNYYRLKFPLEDILIGDAAELTVRAELTDYLTGRVLTDQKVISR